MLVEKEPYKVRAGICFCKAYGSTKDNEKSFKGGKQIC